LRSPIYENRSLLFFPTLDGLKQAYPHAQIDVVVEPTAKAAYQVSKSVNNAIAFEFQSRNSLADWGNLLGNIREREYEVAVFPGQNWTVSFLLWLAGIPTRIGYEGTPGANFFTHTVPRNTNQYGAAAYYDLLKSLNLKAPCPALAVSIPVKDLDWADVERKRLGIGQAGYVLVYGNTDATNNGKTYPVESWNGIIQDFQQKQPDLMLVVVKDENNASLVDALVKLNPSLKVTQPDTTGKLAAMIGGANLMLCTDSAPMQLAVAVQTYTLALFGDNEPKKMLPESNRFIGIKSLSGKMADIAPQTVLEKVWGG